MGARNFAGSSLIDFFGTGLNFTGDTTWAALMRRGADASDDVLFQQNTSSNLWSARLTAGNALRYRTGTTNTDAPTITNVVADGWVLLAISKATGTTNPRFHKYVYSSNSWTHENAATTVADPGSPGTTDVRMGADEASATNFTGDIAVVGIWNKVLADSQLESLPHTLATWWSATPKAIWVLDQSVSTKIPDFTGNGGGENVHTATTRTSASVPIFSYIGSPIKVVRQPAAGVGGSAGPRDLLLLGAG